MRVLHVVQPRHSGVPNVVASMVRAQLAHGHGVAVVCPPASVLWPALAGAGAQLVSWEATREPGPGLPGEVVRLARVIAAFAPDLVHLHAAKAGLAGRLALRGRRPTIYQPQAWSFEAAGRRLRPAVVGWERVAARWADRVLCVSQDECRLGAAEGVAARFVCIPNGVDLERLRPAAASEAAAARERLGLPERPTAMCVARIARQKGIDVLLDAWPLVRADGAQLVIVGDGPEREALVARRVPGVHWAGGREDVPHWLAAADVVVLPSRWEGAPLVALEAMARCRSVVGTDVGGLRQVLEPGAGAVVAVEDADSLAAALALRLSDPGLAAREGATGRRRVEEGYDVRRMNERVIELYRDVLAERHAAPAARLA